MPHQCVHCGSLFENAAQELLTGCNKCGSKFFFFIKQEQYDKLKNQVQAPLILEIHDKQQVEQDVREMIGIKEEEPIILDLESVKVLKPGKFIIDVVSLFKKDRPIIYKLEEGKYIIDLANSMGASKEEINKVIKNPEKKKKD